MSLHFHNFLWIPRLDMALMLSFKLLSRQYNSENFTVSTVTILTTVIKMLKNHISLSLSPKDALGL